MSSGAPVDPIPCPPGEPAPGGNLAIVLSGGGARAAYQVGLLRCLARHAPELRFPIITGVSAGAINAAFLASFHGGPPEAAARLTALWEGLHSESVFRVDTPTLSRNAMRWAARLISGGLPGAPRVRGLVDTAPLRQLLQGALETVDGEIVGIRENVARGLLRALAITTLSYTTGQSITWVDGCDIVDWELPNRRSARARLGLDHVMASAALPLVFPAARIDNHWHGDGSIRLASPLSPALHLGADRILAISARYPRSFEEADEPTIRGYPPPAQVLGQLMNSIFLDLLDQDARRLRRINGLLHKLPPEEHGDLRPVELLVLRPSVDLGRLAAEFEPRLPQGFRFLTRGLGTRETASADFLSILMFEPEYLKRLIAIGESDAERRGEEILAFVAPTRQQQQAASGPARSVRESG